MNGYSDKLIAIDDEMLDLGRPVPPVVEWLRGALPMGSGHIRNQAETCPCRWCRACREWRARIEAWEESNPESAARWLELREQYITQERLELKVRYDDDAWNYEQLRHVGCPEKTVNDIRGRMRETACWRFAREWLLDGTVWSLTLIGGHGCGKSVAAAWLAHQKLMRNFGAWWVDCAHESEAPKYGMEAELRRFRCRSAQVLVLDDLGSPAQYARKDGPWMAWLDDVLGSRANESRKTIITTNRSPADLAGWLGPRLGDRLNAGVIKSTAEPSMRGVNSNRGDKR